jgi:hypothetical protein
MTIDEQLPLFFTLILVLVIGFPFSLIWLGYKATDNTLKRTYPEIGQKSPELQAYLNQGYDLLVIARGKGLIGVHFSVFNYPTKQNLGDLPLFKISFECLGTSQFYLKDCVESFVTEGYTHWLPFQANRVYLKDSLLSFQRQLSIVFSKDKSDFLSVLFPNLKVGELFKKHTVATITGSAIPEGQTWEWQSNTMRIEDDKLVDVTNNDRVLVATFLPAGFIPGEVIYLVVHPDMPKHLVPAFVNLSVLVGRDSS